MNSNNKLSNMAHKNKRTPNWLNTHAYIQITVTVNLCAHECNCNDGNSKLIKQANGNGNVNVNVSVNCDAEVNVQSIWGRRRCFYACVCVLLPASLLLTKRSHKKLLVVVYIRSCRDASCLSSSCHSYACVGWNGWNQRQSDRAAKLLNLSVRV